PRLGLALPFALHALDRAGSLGLPAWIAGAPTCALGPYAARRLPDAPRAFAESCASCQAREDCAGVDPAYLARLGGAECPAASAPPGAPARGPLARLFGGPGDLAPAPARTPNPARVALPLLGKAQPANHEAPASAERRSGEALREILPGLF